ncbi:MAG: right-handed parallel beta-helix repeat-containing protein [Deltaproteobacteria bacterium]|nr:right-handed parallel beta-helix repeat-containing protein [Deltaproteobacteria bacterium]
MRKINLNICLLFAMLAALCFPALVSAGKATYKYDAYDRLNKVNHENGPSVIYLYDDKGNTIKRTVTEGNVLNLILENDAGDYESAVTMDPPGSQCGNEYYCFGNVSTVTLTVAPHMGYDFVSWSNSCGTSPTCTINLDGLYSLTAHLTIKNFDVDTNTGPSGTIYPSILQTVDYRSVLTYEITPEDGYEPTLIDGCGIHHVSGNIYSTAPITSHCTVSVFFDIKSHTVITESGPGGAINPETSQEVYEGTALEFDVLPDAGYIITSVSAEGCGFSNVSGSTYTTLPIMRDCTITALFEDPMPTGLTATLDGSRNVNLAWTDNSSKETGYKVERKQGVGGTYYEIASLAANATSYSDNNLFTGETYYYRVSAFNASGEWAGNEANATIASGPDVFVNATSSCTSGCGSEASPYQTIQAGVNGVGVGDRVIVKAGTYNEQVRITKSLILTSTENAIVLSTSGSYNTAIDINSANVVVSGLTIRPGQGLHGIIVRSPAKYCEITGNIIEDNSYGIVAYFATSSAGSIISDNIIRNNGYGISMNNTAGAVVMSGNEISGNTLSGISFASASYPDVLITENMFSNNAAAISNAQAGISIYHNNFIDNSSQVSNASAQWHNGYPDGGNYWSNYSGVDNYSGAGQDVSGSDGILDAAYGQDLYPFGAINAWNPVLENYSVTYVWGTGGSISPGTPDIVNSGFVVSFDVIPDASHIIDSVMGEGCNIYYDTGDTYETAPITRDCKVTALFQCITETVRIAGSPSTAYTSVQAAYDGAVDGDIIQTRVVNITESVNFNRNISVTLEGGYGCNFDTISGITTIIGNMTLSDGTVTTENIETSP